MNNWFYILLICCIASSPLSGQRIVPTPDDLYTDAVEFMYSGDYPDALEVLLTLHNRGFQTANINYLIGECYLNIQGQKSRSVPFLKDAIRNISMHYKGTSLQEEFAPCKSLLYLGIAYRLNYDFENALHYFNEYLGTLDDADRENARLAEYHIERCNYARELMMSPAKFAADTLSGGINTALSSFNPLVSADEESIVYMDQLKFYDAVMLAHRSDSDWTAPRNLTPEIKSDGDHYATGISADGKKLVLTSYDPYKSGELFSSEYVDSEWTPLQKLNDPVNTVFNETHASLSPDGNTLYFTSDRKGGYGGTDIYRSVKSEGGLWETAINMGPLINTPYNEESPFVSTDGSKLFFSSQGHYNMGGFDVFCSSMDLDGDWLPPVNIGYPLNTTDDDLFFFPVGNGKIAYQSRFTGKSPQSDIIRYVISSYGNPARYIVNGKIDLLADPGYNPPEISVSFFDRNINDTVSVRALNEDGSFRQKLPAGSYKLDFSDNTEILLTRNLEIPDYFPHNNLVFHEELIIPSKITSDTVYLKDILFEFNTSQPGEEYADDIDMISSLLERYPDATVRINGYADARGSEQYNLKLSLRRAGSIKEILESRIEKTLRIITTPFGESNPVALNFNADGSDNAEGRRYNRRVEVLIEDLPDTLKVIRINEVPSGIRFK